ncbi:MAG: hypothetical protein OQK04_09295, partial [Kangiellaceae bacterium]|nr:hypothetical protein [Kangiellaceae bacterium]
NSVWTVDEFDDGNVAVDGTPATVTNFTSIETRVGSATGTDSIDLTSFGNAIILLANYLNFDLIIGNALGTLQGVDGQQNNWSITGSNSGSVMVGSNTTAFTGFSNLLGGNDIDIFTIENGGSISGLINGALGANSIISNNNLANVWALTALYAGTLNGDAFSNIQTITGNSLVSDTLVGINQINDWQITGVNSGTVGEQGVGTSIAFNGIENLTGNDSTDNFVIADSARITGLIDGANGSNSLTSNSNSANNWILTTLYGGTLNGDTFSNIQTLNGNSSVSDTLTGINQNNDWQINGVDSGTVGLSGAGTSIAFNGMENLNGHDANDIFTVADGGRISGLIDGGNGSNGLVSNNNSANNWVLTALYAGNLNGDAFSNIQTITGNSSVSDTLTGINQDNTWLIDSANGGSVGLSGGSGSISFVGMENLNGNNGDDRFQFDTNGSISGAIDAGAHNNGDILDYSLLASVSVDLGVGIGNISNVEIIQGNNTNSTLTAADIANSWIIDGENDGSVGGYRFVDFNNLVGGDLSDLFNLAEGGSVTGNIDGGLGSNTLQRTNTTGTNQWILTSAYQGTLNGGAFENIQILIGSAVTEDTLTSINQNNRWTINGANSGTLSEDVGSPTDTISFSEIENLTGNDGDDRFQFASGGSVSGVIDAGNHINGDIVDYSLLTTVDINLSNAFNGVVNAEVIQGNNTDSTLTGDNVANTWIINGENDGTIGGITFIDFNYLVGGSVDDLFVLEQNGLITGLINGGLGNNTLQRTNTSGTNDWVITGEHQGTINSNPFSQIQLLVGSANAIDTLTGENQDNRWTINGNNSGTLSEDISSPTDLISFSEMDNLNGGSMDDRFQFDINGVISGTVDGGGHNNGDIVDYSLLTTVNINLATAFNGVINAEIAQGNNTDSTLTSNVGATSWLIDGENDGTIGGIRFVDFNNLVGSSADDLFNLAEGGYITGLIDGSGGTNTLQRTNTTGTNEWLLNGQYQGTLNSYQFSNFQILVGSADAVDTLTARNQDNDWLINGTDSGTVEGSAAGSNDLITFSEMENINGGSLDDLFTFAPGGLISGTVDAGDGIDTVDYSLLASVNITLDNAFNGVTNAETVRGNNTNSTLTAGDINNIWMITGENDGTVAGINFENFNFLVGGALNDLFQILEGGSVTGSISGGFGDNTLQSLATTGSNDWVMTGAMQGTLNGLIFNEIQNLIGSDLVTDSLTGHNQNNHWYINGNDSGTLSADVATPSDLITFTGFENLNGGIADDRFAFTETGSISGQIDGGDHVDGDIVDYSLLANVVVTLTNGINGIQNAEIVQGNNTDSTITANNVSNAWLIDGENDGTVAGIRFVDFNNLVGGTADDVFNIAQSGSVTGLIDGGSGNNELQRSNTTGVNEWVITGQHQGTVNGWQFVNFQTLTGSANAVDTLIGRNQNNHWLINGQNSGTLAEDSTSATDLIAFSEMENLNGSDADDRFQFDVNGSITGTIDAGAHVDGDMVDYSLLTTVSVSLANALNGVLNAEIVRGNNTDSTLTADNNSNTWLIDGENDGTISGLRFIDFNYLVGGDADDLFNIAEGGRITGGINGGDGTNTLQRTNTTGTNLWELMSDFAGTINGDSFSNIQILIGSDQTEDTLVARDQDNNWLIDGADQGSVANLTATDLVSFAGMENITGQSGDDRFQFTANGSISGVIDGGAHINGDIVDYSLLSVVDVNFA